MQYRMRPDAPAQSLAAAKRRRTDVCSDARGLDGGDPAGKSARVQHTMGAARHAGFGTLCTNGVDQFGTKARTRYRVKREDVGGSPRSRSVRLTFFETDVDHEGGELSWERVLQLWQRDREFIRFFTQRLLDAATFRDFYWECCPVLGAADKRRATKFECTIVDAHGSLARRKASTEDFHDQFVRAQDVVTAFPNLGNDAILVVPCPSRNGSTPHAIYSSLRPFLESAPSDQVERLFQLAASELVQRLDAEPGRPLWLSTAGQGVPWLHVRLDMRPKYFKTTSYRHVPVAAGYLSHMY